MFRSRTPALAALSAAAVTLAAATLDAAPATAQPAAGNDPIAGFTAQGSRWQRQYEKLFSALPSPQVARSLDAQL
ncbi:hypothetical protein ABZ914_42095 [Spirillospora sp. NPDC046719]